jgi:thiol:disulfide interchange protein
MGQDIYPKGPHGFLYLPQAVWLFTPFFWGPWILDELLWRAAGLGLLAWALFRSAKTIFFLP